MARDAAERPASVQAWMHALLAESSRSGRTSAGTDVAAASIAPSIAVLPLSTFSDDPHDTMLGDGIAEELIHALGRLPGLRVVARTSSFRYRGTAHDIRDIGDALRVRFVLEGSLRRAGNRLRLTTRLIDVSSGYERWSERFDREFTDVFAVQDEIAGAIVSALSVSMASETTTLVRAATNDLTAYEWYLESRYLLAQRTPVALRRAAELLERAVVQDPQFARAFASLAEVHALLAIYGEDAPRTRLPMAGRAAERALSIDAGLAVPHAVLGLVAGVLDDDWDRAEACCLTALSFGDGAATAAQWYAMYVLLPQGRFAEAHAQLQHARQLDPASAALTMSVAVALDAARSHGLAETALRELLVHEPGYGMAHYFLARTLATVGRLDEAAAELATANALLPGSAEVLALRAVLQALAGHKTEARAGLSALVTLQRTRFVSPVMIAELLAALGDSDAALEALVRADALRTIDLLWLGQRPVLAKLTSDPVMAGAVARRRLARAR
jgi:serine/threonine-protein kinase